MCQDTGTAIVHGQEGPAHVWTGFDDEAALAAGVAAPGTTETNLRYSQLAPLSMFKEVNTGDNLPAQIDLFADEGDEYKFLFIAKGGGSANKTFLFQQTPAVMNKAGADQVSRHADPGGRFGTPPPARRLPSPPSSSAAPRPSSTSRRSRWRAAVISTIFRLRATNSARPSATASSSRRCWS